MATDTTAGWSVRCDCGAVVAEGAGAPPSAAEVVGASADWALAHPSPGLGEKIAAHMREAQGGVHRLKVHARVTEAKRR